MNIAINGFGRIGRSVFRILNSKEEVNLVAINDIFDKDALTYLLKYDTVMGRFPEEVKLDGDILKTESQSVKLLAERDPASLPGVSWELISLLNQQVSFVKNLSLKIISRLELKESF